MDALLAMAHGFNDTRLAALRTSGQRPARRRRGAAAGGSDGSGSDSDEDEDAEPQRSPLRTVIVLFLVSTVGLMYWRLALSPLLEPEEGQWLFVLKAALDAAACPECFDGNVLIPTILFLYIWGRLLLRLAGMAAVVALLGSLAYAPWLCLEHRLPAAWDVGGLCRASVQQCQAAIDFAQRGMAAGSDGRYAFVRKRGTVGAMTVREIEHAKRVRGWRRLDLAEDALSPPQELGFDFRWYGQDYDRIQIAADGYMLLLRRGQAAAAPVAAECCAPLDTLHTQPGIAVVAPYYTDLDPTILNKQNNSGIFAGQLEAGWNYGIYANRLAAAESPLGEGNRPDPRHTASWQVHHTPPALSASALILKLLPCAALPMAECGWIRGVRCC